MTGWLPQFLLALLPLLVLVGLLIHGRYPGEKAIERFRRVVSRMLSAVFGRSRLWSSSPVARRWIGGGRLIASSLAGRGPPLHS